MKYLNSLRDKASTYQRCAYFALKKFSEYLVYSDRAEKNIMQHVSAPKNIESIITKQKREVGYLTKDETKLFLETAKRGIGNECAKTKQANWKERDLAILYLLSNHP